MKKILTSAFSVLLLLSCSKDDNITKPAVNNSVKESPGLLTRKAINTKIKSELKSKGDFRWADQDANFIFSALKLSNNTLTIGYGTSENNFKRNIFSEGIKNEVLGLVLENEGINISDKKKTNYLVDEDINVIDIKVTKKSTVAVLLKNKNVRYLEPSSYDIYAGEDAVVNRRSILSKGGGGSGCGYRAEKLVEGDYKIVPPGAKVPWAFYKHNIPQAWDYSTGKGVTIAVVDSGLSPKQRWMNEYFNDGYSSGRFVQKYGTFVDSMWPWSNNYDGVDDKCGHGTSMSSVATAPRNDDKLPVGVAYNANLVIYRAVKNVLVDGYHEKRGITEALTALSKRKDVKVISMSIGHPFTIGRLKDAIRLAHKSGKILICAGGTSTKFTNGYGVIFPASMKETVAVTGVKEDKTTTECDICHKGDKIEFTIQMERASGKKVPVLSYYDGKEDYVGGSSVATATTAGIVALVWSKHPNWTAGQVLQKMRESSQFYPNRNADFGYGNIDVLKAVK